MNYLQKNNAKHSKKAQIDESLEALKKQLKKYKGKLKNLIYNNFCF
jgi:ribosome-associated translation inhibitor RaiA